MVEFVVVVVVVVIVVVGGFAGRVTVVIVLP